MDDNQGTIGVKNSHKCNICEKVFSKSSKLTRHMRIHTKERPYTCPYNGCDKDYSRKEHLNRHIAAIHTGERRFVCPEEGCGKGFYEHGHLTRHVKDVHSTQYLCGEPGCTLAFHKKRQRRRHRVEVHGEAPKYTCPEEGCNRILWSANRLLRHQEYHEKKKERDRVLFLCTEEECKMSFESKQDLLSHQRRVHPRNICPQCSQTFSQAKNLTKHLIAVHGKERSFKCTFQGCTESYTYKHVLKRHMKNKHGMLFMRELPFTKNAFATNKKTKIKHLWQDKKCEGNLLIDFKEVSSEVKIDEEDHVKEGGFKMKVEAACPKLETVKGVSTMKVEDVCQNQQHLKDLPSEI